MQTSEDWELENQMGLLSLLYPSPVARSMESYWASPRLCVLMANGIIMLSGLQCRWHDFIRGTTWSSVRWRGNIHKWLWKGYSLPAWLWRSHFIPFPLLGPCPETHIWRLPSIPFWMGLNWQRKDVWTRSLQDAQRSQTNRNKIGKDTDRKKTASRWSLPALSSLLWLFSHYLIPVLL